MKGFQTFDRERVSFNLAKLKKGGETFEIAIDPDLAIDLKHGKDVDMRDVLKSEDIFSDAKKGTLASESKMHELFNTSDPLKVAEAIINDGQIQLSSEYREKLREEKKNKIVNIIHRNAIDPKTNLPHPPQRIENAFKEAKVHIDEFKKAEEQVEDIVDKLRPIIPIKFATRKIEVHIGSEYAAKLYGTIQSFGKISKDNWLGDGSWSAIVEIPAGLQTDFFEELNNKTHGSVQVKILEE